MNGVSPQSWPAALNSSGGAPTETSRASRSCQHQASAPATSRPIGRSLMMAIVLGGARQLRVQLPLQPGVKGDARGVGLRKAATPSPSGRRRGAGQLRQSLPCCSASAQ